MKNKGLIFKWNFFVLLIFCTTLLFQKISFSERDLNPLDIEKIADFSKLVPLPVTAHQTFKTAVSGNVQLLHRRITIDDLNDVDALEKMKRNSVGKNHLQVLRLGFRFATYKNPLNCKTISIQIADNFVSEPLSCDQVKDNEAAFFTFADPVPPGIYSLKFIGEVNSPFSIYGFERDSHEQWVPALSKKVDTQIAVLIWNWIQSNVLNGVLYLFLILAVIICYWKARATGPIFFLLIASLSFSFYLIMPLYSGHDETAHLTMMKRGVSPSTDEIYFNMQARLSMIDSGFYRLHNARLLIPGECPHFILLSAPCGVSPRPQALYDFYGNILDLLHIKVSGDPVSLLSLGRWINLSQLLALAILVGLYFGKFGLLILLFYVLFVGTYLGQVVSISNDPPMYLLGFFVSIGMTHLLVKSGMRNWCSLFVGFFLFYLGKFIDRSAVAILPSLGMMIFLLVLVKKNKTSQKTNAALGVCIFFVSFLAVLSVGIKWNFFDQILNLKIESLVNMITEDARLLANLSKFNLESAYHALMIYFNSLIGSFIWGHTYLPVIYKLAMGLLALVLGWYGIKAVTREVSKFRSKLILVLLGILFAVQCLVILSAEMARIDDIPIVFESFLKPRLTAPGLGGLLVLPSLGLYWVYCRFENKKYLLRGLCLWIICWQIFLLPFVALKDLY